MKTGGANGAANSRFRNESRDGMGGRKLMEQEMTRIRYQSEHFRTVQGLMCYINEQCVMT